MAPAAAEDDAILDQLAEWLEQGRQVAIATVVQTWGSSPRPAGSQLVVERGGAFLGSVSAGCVEAAVIAAAQESIADRQTRILDFGVSDQQAWEVGLACGGAIRIYVEPVE